MLAESRERDGRGGGGDAGDREVAGDEGVSMNRERACRRGGAYSDTSSRENRGVVRSRSRVGIHGESVGVGGGGVQR